MKAGSWSLLGYVSAQVLRLGANLIVTRLLVPEMFGVVSLFSAVLVVVYLLADIGIRQSVVQSPRGDEPAMLHTAWTMQIVRGFIIWLVCAGIGVGIWLGASMGWYPPDSVYASPVLPMLMIVGSLSIIIQGFSSTKAFTADRHLDQKRLTIIEVISQLVGVVAMIVMAIYWKSVWPLVLGGFFTAIVSVVLSHTWLPGQRDRIGWDKEHAAAIVRFGRWILASSSIFVVANNADRLMLGVWATQAQMAYYSIAQALAWAVEMAAHRIFSSVGMPAFSEVARNDPSRLPQVVRRLRLPLDVVFVVAAGVLYATGPLIIELLYDERYQSAGRILSILSFSLLFTRYGICMSAYSALGHTKYLPAINIAKLISILVLLPLGHRLLGIEGAFWAIALHMAPTVAVYWYYNQRHGLLSVRYELAIFALWPFAYALGLGIDWTVRALM